MPDFALQFNQVSFGYDSHLVLEDATFTIRPRDFVSVIGPNGSGKTTLLRLALGMLAPRAGSVKLFDAAPISMRHRIGYAPQHTAIDLQFPVTSRDVVVMGRIRAGQLLYSREDYRAAQTALARVRLDGVAKKPFGTLSGGQRQRVLLARAICSNPDLLILDEPTSHIDPSSEEILFELLHELNQTMTVIIVSHDVGVVTQHVSQVICVNRKIVVHPTSALNGKLLRELYGSDSLRAIRHDHCCCENHEGL